MKIILALAGLTLLTAGAVQAQEPVRIPDGDQSAGRLVLPSSYFEENFRLIDVRRMATASGVDQIEQNKQTRDAQEKARRNAPLLPVVRDY